MKLNRDKIKILMARNCLTVTKLAENYGVSRIRMNVILNQQEVTPICAGRVAKALDCDVTEILEEG